MEANFFLEVLQCSQECQRGHFCLLLFYFKLYILHPWYPWSYPFQM